MQACINEEWNNAKHCVKRHDNLETRTMVRHSVSFRFLLVRLLKAKINATEWENTTTHLLSQGKSGDGPTFA